MELKPYVLRWFCPNGKSWTCVHDATTLAEMMEYITNKKEDYFEHGRYKIVMYMHHILVEWEM